MGILHLGIGQKSLNARSAVNALAENPYTPPIFPWDIACMFGLSERPVRDAFTSLLEIGAIERQCGCPAQGRCADQKAHNSYRLCASHWPKIKRQWHLGTSEWEPPKKPAGSEGIETPDPLDVDEPGEESETKAKPRGCRQPPVSITFPSSQQEPLPLMEVEKPTSFKCRNRLGIEVVILSETETGGGICLNLDRPSPVDQPVADPIAAGCAGERSPVLPIFTSPPALLRHLLEGIGFQTSPDQAAALAGKLPAGCEPADALWAVRERKERPRSKHPFVAEMLGLFFDKDLPWKWKSAREARLKAEGAAQQQQATQRRLEEEREAQFSAAAVNERAIEEFVAAGGEKLLARAEAECKADAPKLKTYLKLTRDQKAAWHLSRARAIAKRELGIVD